MGRWAFTVGSPFRVDADVKLCGWGEGEAAITTDAAQGKQEE